MIPTKVGILTFQCVIVKYKYNYSQFMDKGISYNKW